MIKSLAKLEMAPTEIWNSNSKNELVFKKPFGQYWSSL